MKMQVLLQHQGHCLPGHGLPPTSPLSGTCNQAIFVHVINNDLSVGRQLMFWLTCADLAMFRLTETALSSIWHWFIHVLVQDFLGPCIEMSVLRYKLLYHKALSNLQLFTHKLQKGQIASKAQVPIILLFKGQSLY